MYLENGVVHGGIHVVERLVAEDAGIVDDDVDRAEGFDGGRHDGGPSFGSGDRVGVGDRLTAESLDLVDDPFGGALIGPGSVDGTTEVVDHHQRPSGREHQGVLASETTTRPGDDRNLAVESEFCCHAPDVSERVRRVPVPIRPVRGRARSRRVRR